MMQITEDTPPDMLAGAMDLTVHLPNGQPPVKMSVCRSTPMMDLLVQVTTAHRLQPTGHIIQALGYAPKEHQSDIILPYKPNMPIGALDTQHIKIIPKSPSKSSTTLNRSSSSLISLGSRAPPHQPFESTFRLQVHLPRNQLYVIRVSQHVQLEDIMRKVCDEKNLDEKKYEFRHPGNLQEVLDPKLSLSDYQLTEVSLVQKGKTISVSDMAALQREEERRRQQSRNGGGVFNLIFKRGKSGISSGSVSSNENRSISPTRSDDSQSRSITPPGMHQAPVSLPQRISEVQNETKPRAPVRKRRPAPKPPSQPSTASSTPDIPSDMIHRQISIESNDKPESNSSRTTTPVSDNSNGLTICHSRNSSDSSGYHEASILSDTINIQSLPRKNKNVVSINCENAVQNESIESKNRSSNLMSMQNQSKSASTLSLTGQKKRRAPPPPPLMTSSVSVTNLSEAVPTSNASSPPPSVVVDIPVEPESNKLEDIPVPIPRTTSLGNLLNLPPKPMPRRVIKSSNETIKPTLKERTKREIVSPVENFDEGALARDIVLEKFDLDASNEDNSLVLSLNRQVSQISDDDFSSISLKSDGNELLGKSLEFSDDSISVNSVESNRKLGGNGNELDCSLISSEACNSIDWVAKFGNISNSGSLKSIQSTKSSEKIVKDLPPIEAPTSFSDDAIFKVPDVPKVAEIVPQIPQTVIALEPVQPPAEFRKIEVPSSALTLEIKQNEDVSSDVNESEWHYQLPSPPSAFRDSSSPTNLTEFTNFDTITFNGFNTESVVAPTQEPLKIGTDTSTLSEKSTITDYETSAKLEIAHPPQEFSDFSDDTSLVSPNSLSLDSLERRKSQVLEKELASLNCEVSQKNRIVEHSNSSSYNKSTELINELQDVIQNGSATLSRSNSRTVEKEVDFCTLPNFKLTTYSPKRVISIFEDDSIRSNVDNKLEIINKKKSFDSKSQSNGGISERDMNIINTLQSQRSYKRPVVVDIKKKNSTIVDSSDSQVLNKNHINGNSFSTENIHEKIASIQRADSFSVPLNNLYSETNGIKRSKSQLVLNKHNKRNSISENESEVLGEDNIRKTSSQWNVSELQSLQVMRSILPKISNSSPNSPEQESPPATTQKPVEIKEEKRKSETPRVAWSPPSINLGTWSERPKSQVSLKQDKDYKISNGTYRNQPRPHSIAESFDSKLKIPDSDDVSKDVTDSVKINVINRDNQTQHSNGNICIKVNQDASYNIVHSTKDLSSQSSVTRRLINHTTVGFNRSENGFKAPRPHSIALDTYQDLSRMPIVRSVELKKPSKEINVEHKTVTDLFDNNGLNMISDPCMRSQTLGRTGKNFHRSSETVNSGLSKEESYSSNNNLSQVSKTINRFNNNQSNVRNNIFGNRISFTTAPVVKGFRTVPTKNLENSHESRQNGNVENKPRTSWKTSIETNGYHSENKAANHFSTLPNKLHEKDTIKYTNTININENHKMVLKPQNSCPLPPPPMPKVTALQTKKSISYQPMVDPRDQLLESIRNFGKNSLRKVK